MCLGIHSKRREVERHSTAFPKDSPCSSSASMSQLTMPSTLSLELGARPRRDRTVGKPTTSTRPEGRSSQCSWGIMWKKVLTREKMMSRAEPDGRGCMASVSSTTMTRYHIESSILCHSPQQPPRTSREDMLEQGFEVLGKKKELGFLRCAIAHADPPSYMLVIYREDRDKKHSTTLDDDQQRRDGSLRSDKRWD